MLLQIRDLNTYYGASHVLQGISLYVARGELVALLGRNGMGKSTTLKTVMGLVKGRSGSVTFDGREITGHAPYKVARAGIGYVPEERRIFPELSVLDNLLLGIKGGKIADPTDPKVWTIDRIFHHFPRLKERIHQKGKFLSGGEQQMLAIGRALMARPRLLMLDEPSMGLAPRMVTQVYQILAELKAQGTTILLVEQNARAALKVADRGYVLETGRIILDGTAADLRDDPEVQRAYLGKGYQEVWE